MPVGWITSVREAVPVHGIVTAAAVSVGPDQGVGAGIKVRTIGAVAGTPPKIGVTVTTPLIVSPSYSAMDGRAGEDRVTDAPRDPDKLTAGVTPGISINRDPAVSVP